MSFRRKRNTRVRKQISLHHIETLEQRTLFASNVFVASAGGIDEYTDTGVAIATSIVPSDTGITGFALAGTDLYVAYTGGNPRVDEYTTAGTLVTSPRVSGFQSGVNLPEGVAVAGSDLFVVDEQTGTIGEYTTTGAVVNASLISGLISASQIVISGSALFVAQGNFGVSEFTTAGVLVNSALISGVSASGVAVSGSDLFVSNYADNSIGEYTTSGQTVNASLISIGAGYSPGYLTVSGSELFVNDFETSPTGSTYPGRVEEYSTSGTTISESLIPNISDDTGAPNYGIVAEQQVAGSPAQLSFASVPSTAVAGSTISPAITVDVEDANGILVTTDTSTVTLSIGIGPIGARIGGTTSVVAVDGVATFTDITLSLAGNYALTAINGALTSATSSTIAASAQTNNLFITSFSNGGTVGEYTTSGGVVNANLVSGLGSPLDIANAGSDLFISNFAGTTVGEYDTSGATINASYIPNLVSPAGLAVAGNQLLYAQNSPDNGVNEVDLSDGQDDGGIGLAGAYDLAASATEFFATYGSSGTISEAAVPSFEPNSTLLTLPDAATGIAVSGSDLFIAFPGSNSIGEYTTSGVTVNASLITGLDAPESIAIAGSDLFVVNEGNGTVGEYTTAGATINSALITGLGNAHGITIVPADNVANLTFAQQPTGAVAGGTIEPVTVDVDNVTGSTIVSDNSQVTLSIASGPAGATLAGTTTVTAVNGVATFTGLSINTAGTYTLTATDGSDTAATSNSFTISAVAPPPSPVETIGGLDPTYGTNGIASHNVGFTSTAGVATDGSQSVLIGPIGTSPSETFGVTRYNSDGSVDTSFGTSGVVSMAFGSADAVPSAVDVLANGDILVAGTATTFAADGVTVTGSEFAVAEYTSSGTLNTAFGTAGQVLISFSSSGALSNDLLNAMTIGMGGTIYLAGSSDAAAAGNPQFAVAALSSSGAIDTAFDGGKVLFGSIGDSINGLAVQKNGDIVAAGSATVNGVSQIAVARLLTTGKLDTHFGNKGIETNAVGSVYDSASSVAIQSNGAIVVAGLTGSGSGNSLSSDFVVQRYTSAGKLDRSFAGGTVTTSFGQPSAATTVLLQSNGEILVSGKTTASLTNIIPDELDLALARYTTRGTLDTTFNATGKVIVDLGSGTESTAGILSHSITAADVLTTADTSTTSEFNRFDKLHQGAATKTPGGQAQVAGNSGASSDVAQTIMQGIDLIAKLLSTLPASTLGGAKGTATVSITENGTTQAVGTVTLTLQLANDSAGTDAVTVHTLTTKINLRQGQIHSYKLQFNYSTTLANGNYYLIAKVTDATGVNDLNQNNNTAPSSSAVTIAPPKITLSSSTLTETGALAASKPAKFSIDITNNGNIPANGNIEIELVLSPDQTTTDGVTIATPTLHINQKASVSQLYHLTAKLNASIPSGTQYLIAVVDPTDSLGSHDTTVASLVVDPTALTIG
jgi:uncharacterized delta-60 repeat protein